MKLITAILFALSGATARAANSLDLSPIGNCLQAATPGAPISGAWYATGDLSEDYEDSNLVQVFVDTSGGDVAVTPTAVADSAGNTLNEGDIVQLINIGGGGALTFTDGNGLEYTFADQDTEFLCLKAIKDDPQNAKDYVVF